LLEEADKADRIGILHEGQTVAVGRPADLRLELGEQVLSITTSQQAELLQWLTDRHVTGQVVETQIRVAGSQAAEIIQPINEAFGAKIHSMTLGRPGLEDVFVARTGHRFWNEAQAAPNPRKGRAKPAATGHAG
jgi:ABC-2 type transport system ATP-binding protein